MGLCCGPRSGKVAAQKRTGLQPEFYLHFKISGNCWESPRYLELPVFGLRLVGGGPEGGVVHGKVLKFQKKVLKFRERGVFF